MLTGVIISDYNRAFSPYLPAPSRPDEDPKDSINPVPAFMLRPSMLRPLMLRILPFTPNSTPDSAPNSTPRSTPRPPLSAAPSAFLDACSGAFSAMAARVVRRIAGRALLGGALATLAACADQSGIAPHAHMMDANRLDPGAQVRAQAQAQGQAAADAKWPSLEWWRVYGDPQLDSLVAAAIADNPTQAVAAARLREALSLADSAHARTLPTLDATASLNRRHWPESGYYSGGFGGRNTFDNTGYLHFAYPLDLFGADRNADEQAVDTAHAAAADARAAQLSLESNVVRTYVNLSLQYALQDVAQRTLEDQTRILDLANRRFAAGIATQLEVSEAQAPLPNSRLSLEQIAEAIALTRNELASLIGQGPGAGDTIVRPTLRFDQAVALPSTLPAELIGHRPDVVAQRWRVEAQARAIDVAKAAFYPNIDLLASGGGSAVGSVFSTFTRLSSMGFTAGPAISLPIFEGGRLRAGLDAASARYDIAASQYNDTVLRALREISDQVVTFQSLERQRREADLSVATAQRSYDIALSGFQRGLTDYLNVLTAEDRLLQQQQGVKRIEASRFNAYADLMAALGGGLGSEPTTAPRADAKGQTAGHTATASAEAAAPVRGATE